MRCHCGRHCPRITIPVGGHYARSRRLRRHQLGGSALVVGGYLASDLPASGHAPPPHPTPSPLPVARGPAGTAFGTEHYKNA
ncbi:hypothetical protein BHE74_00031492 [Ensete ventricosum]|nr:hypothetical protein BHE74_00031492 [Ensete ventricosum]